MEKEEEQVEVHKEKTRVHKYDETDRLLAELEALEWLHAQIVVLTLGISNNNNEPTTAVEM